MNIYLENIHLPNFFSGDPDTFIGALGSRIASNMNVVSNTIRYNELTYGGAILAINLGLLYLSEKIITFASQHFSSSKSEWVRVRYFSSILFKCTFVGVGVYAINNLMNLQLKPYLLAISVISTIALQLLCQKVIDWVAASSKGNSITKETGKKNPDEENLKDEKKINPTKEKSIPPAQNNLKNANEQTVKKNGTSPANDLEPQHQSQESILDDGEKFKEQREKGGNIICLHF